MGSNLGDKLNNLKTALSLLKKLPLSLEKISTPFETEPLYFESSNKFINLAIKLKTSLSPFSLFFELKKIEFSMGRVKTPYYTDRPIDLDIIFYEDLVMESELLKIPHPRAFERAFVMLPLLEIAPDFIDPLSGKTLKKIYQENRAFLDSQKIKPLKLRLSL